jgi:hypothetical protein
VRAPWLLFWQDTKVNNPAFFTEYQGSIQIPTLNFGSTFAVRADSVTVGSFVASLRFGFNMVDAVGSLVRVTFSTLTTTNQLQFRGNQEDRVAPVGIVGQRPAILPPFVNIYLSGLGVNNTFTYSLFVATIGLE